MINVSKQQVVICVLIGVLSCGFFLFRYLPLRSKQRAIKEKINVRNSLISKGAIQAQQLPLLKKELADMQHVTGNFERQVPTERDLGAFLNRIADLMHEHDLVGQVVEPGQEKKVAGLNCIPVKMQCRGTISQLFGFYDSLRQVDRVIRIEDVQIDNQADFGGLLNMRTSASIYYKSDKEPDRKNG